MWAEGKVNSQRTVRRLYRGEERKIVAWTRVVAVRRNKRADLRCI